MSANDPAAAGAGVFEEILAFQIDDGDGQGNIFQPQREYRDFPLQRVLNLPTHLFAAFGMVADQTN